MTPKSLKPWLMVSVLLNVFLLGGVGGGLYHWMATAKPVEAVVNRHGLRQAMFKLPPERRRELRQLLRHNRADSQPLIMAGREARLGVIQQLQAPTLDRDVLVAELAKAREADMALRTKRMCPSCSQMTVARIFIVCAPQRDGCHKSVMQLSC